MDRVGLIAWWIIAADSKRVKSVVDGGSMRICCCGDWNVKIEGRSRSRVAADIWKLCAVGHSILRDYSVYKFYKFYAFTVIWCPPLLPSCMRFGVILLACYAVGLVV